MGKFLDDVGLGELWRKIKSGFLPIKRLTKEEYESLSEEEKKRSILYDVRTDVSEEGD